MKVIFLHDVPRVGKKHEVKDVNGGYALNFLLPKKLVEVATPSALAKLELKKKEIAIEREVQEDLLVKNLEEIKGKIIHLSVKADKKGHLFSGIHAKEIAEAMEKEHRVYVAPEFIALEKPIKEIGEFNILVMIRGRKSSFVLRVDKI